MLRPSNTIALVCAGWAALILAEVRAWAVDDAYQSYPLGGRAVGLAGAFTALADGPSGLFYNPAGLVDIERGSIQVGTNLYGLQVQGGITDAFGAVVDVDRIVTELDIIPSTASGISVLERDAQGRPLTVYALGSFVPASRSSLTSVINELDPAERFPGCRRLAYERTLSDRRFLFGGGVAHRIDDQWSVGFSGFLDYRALRDRQEITCSEQSPILGTSFSTADTRVNLSVFAIKLAFAAKYRFADGWRFGAHLTTPSIRAIGQAGVRVRRSRSLLESGQNEFFLREVEDVPADTRDGLALRFGLAREWPGGSAVSVDLSVHAPISYQLVDLPPAQRGVVDAITLVTDIQRNWVVNGSVGGEYRFDDGFSLAGGLFSNLSSAPTISGSSGDGFAQDRLPHVNELGATLVAGFFTESNLTRAGVIMSYGEGTDVIPRYAGLAALGGRTEYVRVDIQQATLYVFISTTIRY